MKRHFLLPFLALAAHGLVAQCSDVPISNDAVVINSNGTYTYPIGTHVWVCSGVTATISGPYLLVFAESNTDLTVMGDNAVGFIKQPGSLESIGDNCTWAYGDGVSVTHIGNVNTGYPCEITYDYSAAPSNGCVGVAGLAEHERSGALEVFPDPAQDMLTIRVDGVLHMVEVLDMSGRMVVQARGTGGRALDVRALRAGTYIVRVHTDGGMLTERFIKQ